MRHKQEIKIVQDWLNCFKCEIKDMQKYKSGLVMNPKWIELSAKIEFAEKLLE